MVFSIPFLPTKSTLLHMRFAFAFFLLPVYVFALSQVQYPNWKNAVLVFVVWHLCVYPASNGYNSYFDKDEGSIALLEKPPRVDKSLYYFSLLLEALGIGLSFWVSIEFAFSAMLYGLLSKSYSHPSIRLKKFPMWSFLIVFVFQGAFVYWTSYAAIARQSVFENWTESFFLAGLICSCLIGASYPLTQVYQHEEDSKRGDTTLSLLLGVRGSFFFSAILFLAATLLMLRFWMIQGKPGNFWLFLAFILPAMFVFLRWFVLVWKDERKADFKNMSLMTKVSGSTMFVYFLLIWIVDFL